MRFKPNCMHFGSAKRLDACSERRVVDIRNQA